MRSADGTIRGMINGHGDVMGAPDDEPLSGVELEEAMVALLTDPTFRRLEYQIGRENFLSVLGRSFTERWHSAFLGWLLSSESDHGLGVIPMGYFLLAVSRAAQASGRPAIPVADLLGSRVKEAATALEFPVLLPGTDKRLYFDIFAEGTIEVRNTIRKLSVVVENKVKADERQDQTKDYELCIAEMRRVLGIDAPTYDLRVFLIPTREGDDIRTPSGATFIPFSYQQLYDEVIRLCLSEPQLSVFGRTFLQQYVANLRSPVAVSKRAFPMAKIEDDSALITEIYNKHSRVLNTIMLYVRGESDSSSAGPKAKFVGGELGDLLQQGYLKPGAVLAIKGREVQAQGVVEVRGGVAGFVWNGNFYTSPSPAATAVYGSNQNGWTAWKLMVDGKPGPSLSELRAQLREASPENS